MLDLPELLGALPFEIALGTSGVPAALALPEMLRAWRALSSARAIAAARSGGAADGGLVIAEGRAAALAGPRPTTLWGRESVRECWRVERRTRGRHRRRVLEEEGASPAPFLLRMSEGAVLVCPTAPGTSPCPDRHGTAPRRDRAAGRPARG